MADFSHGFEGVSSGTTITNANSVSPDSQFNTVTGGSIWTFSTTGAITGLNGGRVLTSTATAWRAYDSFAGVTQLAGRIGFTFNAAVPGILLIVDMIEGTGFSASVRLGVTGSPNHFFVSNAAGTTLATQAGTIALNTAYYVEVQADVGGTTTNGTINCQLYTAADPSTLLLNYAPGATVNAGAGKTLVRGQLGDNTAVASLDLTFDNVLWRTATLTPIGPPPVLVPAGNAAATGAALNAAVNTTTVNAAVAASTGVPPAAGGAVSIGMTIRGI